MNKDVIFEDLVDMLWSTSTGVECDTLRFDDTPFQQYGIGSRSLIRLVGRAEERFGIKIGDGDASVAFSFQRLVDLIEQKMTAAGVPLSLHLSRPVPGHGSAPNLLAAIEAKSRAAGDRADIRFLDTDTDTDGGGVTLSHEKFLRTSVWLGQQIMSSVGCAQCPPRAEPPQAVVIVANEPLPTLLAFFAALGVGAWPLIFPPPRALRGLGAFSERLARVTRQFAGRCVLAMEENLLPAYQERAQQNLLDLPDLPDLPDVSLLPLLPLPTSFAGYGTAEALPPPQARGGAGSDVAFLQMTSAATGDGRLVAISHANACANLAALRSSLELGPDERIFTWLPLYHDMGLVGGVLLPFFHGYPTTVMKPSDFVESPPRWLRGISESRATVTGAPDFGIDYACRMVSDGELPGVDLSTLRRVVVGAEPRELASLQGFADRFGPYGFRPDSFVPAFGLAESTLGGTASVGVEPRFLVIEAGSTSVGAPVRILDEGRVRFPAEPRDDSKGIPVVSLGRPLEGMAIHLRSDDGEPIAAEGVLGEIVMRGPSISVGYFEPALGAPVPFPGGTLATGDLGFIHGGELFVLERKKNVIIRNGQNFPAPLLEQRVARVLGVPSSSVIILDTDIYDASSDIHVVVEGWSGEAELSADQQAALRALELPVDLISFARRRVIPRTTSGKKRYHVCRRQLAEQMLPISRTLRLHGS
jgi:acyl-CoA synthetase (AMP-forming)/AMP-acid ligase II/acyl carrier protein